MGLLFLYEFYIGVGVSYYLFCLLNDNSSDYFYLVGVIVSMIRRVRCIWTGVSFVSFG